MSEIIFYPTYSPSTITEVESEEIKNEMDLEVSETKEVSNEVELSEEKNNEKSDNPLFTKINSLRKANKDFDSLVSEIDAKIEIFISEINSSRSFNPVPASSCRLKIYVIAIPFTAEEKKCLIEYLDKKYLEYPQKLVGGNYFDIKKRLFSNQYCIRTKYYHYDI